MKDYAKKKRLNEKRNCNIRTFRVGQTKRIRAQPITKVGILLWNGGG
jgi:hypothetical protein